MEEPADFREWMRFEMAKSERRYRETMALHRREMDRILGRNDRVIERNTAAFHRFDAAMDRFEALVDRSDLKIDAILAELRDHRVEHREMMVAIMNLRESIERWLSGPGPGAAPA
jgi:hypothetical protein